MALFEKLAQENEYFKKVYEKTDPNIIDILKNDEQVKFYIWSQPDFKDELLPVPTSYNPQCVDLLIDWFKSSSEETGDTLAVKLRPLFFTSNNFQELFKFNINRGIIFKTVHIDRVKELLNLEIPKILCYFLDYVKSLAIYQQYALAIFYYKFIEDSLWDKNIFLNFISQGPIPPKSDESIRNRWRNWGKVDPTIEIPITPITETPQVFTRKRAVQTAEAAVAIATSTPVVTVSTPVVAVAASTPAAPSRAQASAPNAPKPPIRTASQIPKIGVRQKRSGFSINAKSASIKKPVNAPIRAHQGAEPIKAQAKIVQPLIIPLPQLPQPNSAKAMRERNRALLKDRRHGHAPTAPAPTSAPAQSNKRRETTRRVVRQAQQAQIYNVRPLESNVKVQPVAVKSKDEPVYKIRSEPVIPAPQISTIPLPTPPEEFAPKKRIHIREKIKDLQVRIDYEQKLNTVYAQIKDHTLLNLATMQRQISELKAKYPADATIINLYSNVGNLQETITRTFNGL